MATSRNQSFSVILASGTTAGTYDTTIVLDRKYAASTGWAVYMNGLGGLTYVEIGLRDDTTDILNPTNSKFLEAGIDCPKTARLTPVQLICDGTNLYVQVKTSATLTSDLKMNVVFSLQKD